MAVSGITIKRTNSSWEKELIKRYGKGIKIAVGLPRGGDGVNYVYPAKIRPPHLPSSPSRPLLTVAMINEFGQKGPPDIPARPFIKPGGKKASRELRDVIANAVRQCNSRTELKAAFDSVGMEAAGIIQQYMADLKEPGNAPLTVKLKGFDNPLVETGRLKGTITYQTRGLDK